MAEIFLSAFIEVLFEKVTSRVLSKLALLGGIHQSQLHKWNKTLSTIRAVISDAEEKQIEEPSVQIWLHHLQDLAYDLDDILDELITQYSRRELDKETHEASTSSSSKVWCLIPTCCTSFTPAALKFNYDMGSKLEDITNRLQHLANQKNVLNLRESVGGVRSYGTRETTSFLDESHVCGRKTDKEELLKLLLRCDNEQVCVIPIVGMGGVGKTTLAQLVYNDHEVKACFDLNAWVCVSDVFDEFKITSIIFESVAKTSHDFKSLNMVQESLKEKLLNKKFLIVLDDVWNENYGKWDLLRTPFLVGALGSKIVVTTRNDGVASIMRSDSIPAFHLKQLTNDDCLSVLAQHALGTRNFEDHPNLKVIGEAIARKCNGLPLAAKTLGGLLRTKDSPNEWEKILKSKIWELPEERSDILPALRLSYHHLPPYLKRLFVYSSVFPKDYQFDKYELVLLWIAEGFLQQSKVKAQMEELGFEYFNELLSRSFFQRSSGNESQFVMHDLLNDLAQFVAGGICCNLDDNMKCNGQHTISEKARHSSFIRPTYGVFNKFETFNMARSLRTFLPLPVYRSGSWESFYLSNRVVNDLMSKLQCLRVLSLSGYSITELPNSIGDLLHLRYLNLSHTRIKQLPESVSDLYNLQTLLLRSCRRLSKLPTRIANLVNLRHLDISGTVDLQELPSGIGSLTSLQTLSKIILGKSNKLRLTELRGLSDLKGELSIIGLDNVKNAQDAREAILLGKKGLDELMLTWSSDSNDSRNETLEKEVLELLKPHRKLTKLRIEFYGGTEFPSWVGDPSLSNITHLRLDCCKKCTFLPSVGQLPSLKELCIRNMFGVKNVGVELYGSGYPHAVAFPSLETLTFESMECWEEWSTGVDESVGRLFPCLGSLTVRDCPKLIKVSLPMLQSIKTLRFENMECLEEWGTNVDENVGVFPCLGKLTIDKCPKLMKVSLPKIPSVRVLDIRGCCEMALRSMVSIASSVTSLEITDIGGLIKLDEGVVKSVEDSWWQSLRQLKVTSCSELVSLVAEEEQVWPPNLEVLEIKDCKKLEKLPNNLTSLRKLDIYGCPRLQSSCQTTTGGHMESFSHLEDLSITGCSSLTFFPTGQNLPTTLQKLYVGGCSNLEADSDTFWVHNNSIESIRIDGWVNLKWLPGCLFSFHHLTELRIWECPGLESFPERGGGLPPSLRELVIYECKNLKSLPDDDQMQSLTSLGISGCPSLESFPRVWPPNLTRLTMGENDKLSEWGRRLPTSLVSLWIHSTLRSMVSIASSVTSLQIADIGGLIKLDEGVIKSVEESWWQSLRKLKVSSCSELVSLVAEEEQVWPPNLEELDLSHCVKLEKLPNNLTSIRKLTTWRCPRLQSSYQTTTGGHMESFSHLEYLWISGCSSLTCFPTGQNLPTALQKLYVDDCSNMEADSDTFWVHNNSIERIEIHGWVNLKWLPGCLFSFHHLTELRIFSCPGLESFPERGGLPPSLREFRIYECKNLKSLPDDDQMQSLTSLRELSIRGCPSLESFPRVWPPNLTHLSMGENGNGKLSEWGRLPTSLVQLIIQGDFPQVVSFTDVVSFPTSLTELYINGLVNLEGLQNLTSLEQLYIFDCPKLRSLPAKLLPTLSRLYISSCPVLKERCLKEKRDYWANIAHIPRVEIDGVSIHEL